jgi:hypothetical protein
VSEENVELVRRMFAVSFWERMDEFWEPDGDYYPVRRFPESRPCHGVDEIVRFLRDYLQAWGGVEFEIKSITAVADDRVLARVNLVAEGRGSALNMEGEVFNCFWLRHGRIFRQEDHLTREGALHALGLGDDDLGDDARP